MDGSPGGRTSPGAPEIFWTFFRISAITIGGGYAMVPVIGREVAARGWMEESEFYDLFSLAQSFPGPIALNTALVVGRRLGGGRGFCLAMTGILIPPFVSVLAAALLLRDFGGIPPVRGFLDGAAAVIPGLVGALLWRMCVSRKWTVWRAACTLCASAAVIAFGSWAIPLFFVSVLVSLAGEIRA
ncbi:MAG TPA: chromate transporter [Magnetospirillaceae bacterium]|nr:chromate transporter [Magnetospirillaceae bacterium]